MGHMKLLTECVMFTMCRALLNHVKSINSFNPSNSPYPELPFR